jgi:hypothetical protein
MKISQIIINESEVGTTTAGGIATVSETVGKVNVRGLEPAEKVMKGKAKKKGPYANSLSEGKKVDEAKLDEEDKIIAVGKGKKLKTGLHGKSEESKLKGFRAPFKSQGVFVSDKRGNKVCECDDDGIAQEVAKALTAYAIANEGAGVIAGGEQYEGQQWPDSSNSLAKRGAVTTNLKGAPSKAGRSSGMTVATRVDPTITPTTVKRKDSDKPIPKFLQKEGAKVDRMVGHIKQSEREAGHDAEEAENIAWATANKRGMLNNKNKKKHK